MSEAKGKLKVPKSRSGICYCNCHSHPIRREPCAVCGHYNAEGDWIGGVRHGYWSKRGEGKVSRIRTEKRAAG